MLCEKCGKILPEGIKFCDSCGAPVNVAAAVNNDVQQQPAPQQTNTQQPYTQQTGTQQPYTQQTYTQQPYTQQIFTGPVYEQKREPVSVGGFIGRNLIPLIPFVGGLVYLIMLFVWAGDKTKEETFQNWAKAQLWIMLIVVIVAIVIGIIVGASIAASGASLFDEYRSYSY